MWWLNETRGKWWFLNKISSHPTVEPLQFGHVNYSLRERDTLVLIWNTRSNTFRTTFNLFIFYAKFIRKIQYLFSFALVLRIMTRHSTLSWKKSTLVRSSFHFWPQDFSLNQCRNTYGIADGDGSNFQYTDSDYSKVNWKSKFFFSLKYVLGINRKYLQIYIVNLVNFQMYVILSYKVKRCRILSFENWLKIYRVHEWLIL